MNIGDTFPNFSANTTIGQIDFYNWLESSWGVLFSHPADFTPVCTTELSRLVELIPEFEKRNVKIIALSCDSVSSHEKWIDDIKHFGGYSGPFPYPIIDDEKRELAVKLNMLDKDEIGKAGLPLTCRAVFVIDSQKKFRLSILYPATTGRNFTEILRVIDSMQLTDKYKVATPADWRQGGDCMVLPTLSADEANNLFPAGFSTVSVPSGKDYIRKTKCPNVD
ncbi:peroxiredoxin-6 isoform X2 [Phlebotomus papatasi]|uniref:peroxiredoxin-6 isoform X2 n=1 Tax=Phlebotomus papatasi TaxID=29031 RepID=UPI0024841C13|nr:peroxiredoxin-6 isoform X2 [Phlebotomus papatasi]